MLLGKISACSWPVWFLPRITGRPGKQSWSCLVRIPSDVILSTCLSFYNEVGKNDHWLLIFMIKTNIYYIFVYYVILEGWSLQKGHSFYKWYNVHVQQRLKVFITILQLDLFKRFFNTLTKHFQKSESKATVNIILRSVVIINIFMILINQSDFWILLSYIIIKINKYLLDLNV